MKDRYFSTEECTNRLVRDFYKHDNIIIAVDFDNTIHNFMGRGYSESLVHLLKVLRHDKENKFTFILFTAREGVKLIEAEQCCKSLGIKIHYVNESPVMTSMRKPFYNILLDDKAGLGQAYEVLTNFLKIIDYDH